MSKKNPRQYASPPYLGHASAVALAGHVDRVADRPGRDAHLPVNVPLDGVSCSLPLNGGRASTTRTRLNTMYRGQSLASCAWARAEVSLRLADEQVTTRAAASTADVYLGLFEKLSIQQCSAEITSLASRTTPSAPERFTLARPVLEGVAFQDEPLELELAPDLFRKDDTYEQVVDFVNSGEGESYLLPHSRLQKGDSAAAGKRIALHIVRSLKWGGHTIVEQRGGKRRSNGAYLPEIGQVYFGEMLIDPDSRRLTLIRIQLGCPADGSAVMGDVDDNGQPVFGGSDGV